MVGDSLVVELLIFYILHDDENDGGLSACPSSARFLPSCRLQYRTVHCTSTVYKKYCTCRLVYVDPTTIEKGALLGACSCTRSKFARACVRALVLSQSPLRRCQPREEVLSARGVMSSRAVVCVRLKFRRSAVSLSVGKTRLSVLRLTFWHRPSKPPAKSQNEKKQEEARDDDGMAFLMCQTSAPTTKKKRFKYQDREPVKVKPTITQEFSGKSI
jgi:hypothetical protein